MCLYILGVFKATFRDLKAPETQYQLREVDTDFVKRLVDDIKANGHTMATVLPVLALKGVFDADNMTRCLIMTLWREPPQMRTDGGGSSS